MAIPESVPGLIAMLNEKEKQEVPVYRRTRMFRLSRNRPAYNATINCESDAVRTQTVEVYPFRSYGDHGARKAKKSAGGRRSAADFAAG